METEPVEADPPMTQLELLQSIEFHDVPVTGLRFDLGEVKDHSFVIDFKTLDDAEENYVEWSLQLKDLVKFVSSEIELASDSSVEIFSFDFEAHGNFKGVFEILTGPGKLNISIEFECRTFVLSNRT